MEYYYPPIRIGVSRSTLRVISVIFPFVRTRVLYGGRRHRGLTSQAPPSERLVTGAPLPVTGAPPPKKFSPLRGDFTSKIFFAASRRFTKKQIIRFQGAAKGIYLVK